MLYVLGADFLYVDGGCHYWIQQPSSIVDDLAIWRPYREGHLTSAQERQLHAAVGYDDITVGTAASSCEEPRALHQSHATLWDGMGVLTCRARFRVSADWPLRDELYAQATDLTGPLRIQIGRDSAIPGAPVHDWPLDVSIDEYFVDSGDTKSFRIDDGEAIDALRELRGQAIDAWTAAPAYFGGTIPVAPPGSVRDSAETYVLSLRDDLPFTNSEGAWAPP